MDWKHSVLDAGIADALEVLRGAEPQIGGPDLGAKLSAQEDRRQRAPAAKVQHSHAGPQVQSLAKPFSQPEAVSSAADAGEDPFGVVARGTRKLLGDQPVIHGGVRLLA